MEMEDHHHHQQYNMATDLRQLVMNGAARSSTHFPTAEQLFSGHRNLVTPDPPHPHPHQQQHYEMMMLMPRGVVLDDFPTTTTNDSVTVTVPPTQAASNPEATGYVGGDASTGRWPRQETLSLLEIRSRLDPKFKDANQKGPLWDEVSRFKISFHSINLILINNHIYSFSSSSPILHIQYNTTVACFCFQFLKNDNFFNY